MPFSETKEKWQEYKNFLVLVYQPNLFISALCRLLVVIKMNFHYFSAKISSFLAWTFHYFSFFSIFLSHAVQQKILSADEFYRQNENPEEPTEKKCFIYFSIFFSRLICVCAHFPAALLFFLVHENTLISSFLLIRANFLRS